VREHEAVNREVRPSTIAPPAANYAHAIITENVTRWLHTSGVVPVRPDGSVPPGIEEQLEVVWSTIRTLVIQARMKPIDIVSVVTYVVDGESLVPVMAARDAFFGRHRAASTLITVPRLARPEWKVEIAVIAATS
jgi:enamine deaminase RidA (YjgF/YER057c/UK114 family)